METFSLVLAGSGSSQGTGCMIHSPPGMDLAHMWEGSIHQHHNHIQPIYLCRMDVVFIRETGMRDLVILRVYNVVITT